MRITMTRGALSALIDLYDDLRSGEDRGGLSAHGRLALVINQITGGEFALPDGRVDTDSLSAEIDGSIIDPDPKADVELTVTLTRLEAEARLDLGGASGILPPDWREQVSAY